MPHPFFDNAAYPWDRAYARELHRLLYLGNDNFTLTKAIYAACGGNGLRALAEGAPDDVWRAFLNNLCDGGMLQHFFDKFEELKYPRSIPLQNLMKAIRSLALTEEQMIFSDGDKVILDRREMRLKLVELRKEHGSTRVLLVRGDRHSGKTHGVNLFNAMAEDEGADCVNIYAGAHFTLQDVLSDLFGILNASIPPVDTSQSGWDKLACSKLMGEAKAQNKRLWIAVDDLGVDADGDPFLDGKILQFFNTFAAQMLNPPYRKFFRLMFLHYPEGIPTQWREEIWAEDFPHENNVQEKEVEDCLNAWAAHANVTLLEAHAKQYAAEIIATADAPDAGDKRPRLKRIHDLVVAKMRTLKGGL